MQVKEMLNRSWAVSGHRYMACKFQKVLRNRGVTFDMIACDQRMILKKSFGIPDPASLSVCVLKETKVG